MDGLWIYERMIHVLFSAELHERARAYAIALNRVVWQGPPDGATHFDFLERPKGDFLDAARAELA